MIRHYFYYLVTDPAIMEAHNADLMDVARIEARAEAFALSFGAKPLFTTGWDSRFAGITFLKGTLPMQPQLWTKLVEGEPALPRSPERAGSKDRAAAEALYKRFWDTWPKDIAAERASKLYTALGLRELNVDKELFVFEESGGNGYIMSTLQFPFTEIITSDFIRMLVMKDSPMKPVPARVVAAHNIQGAIRDL